MLYLTPSLSLSLEIRIIWVSKFFETFVADFFNNSFWDETFLFLLKLALKIETLL